MSAWLRMEAWSAACCGACFLQGSSAMLAEWHVLVARLSSQHQCGQFVRMHVAVAGGGQAGVQPVVSRTQLEASAGQRKQHTTALLARSAHQRHFSCTQVLQAHICTYISLMRFGNKQLRGSKLVAALVVVAAAGAGQPTGGKRATGNFSCSALAGWLAGQPVVWCHQVAAASLHNGGVYWLWMTVMYGLAVVN
jgi:hypothetical protein